MFPYLLIGSETLIDVESFTENDLNLNTQRNWVFKKNQEFNAQKKMNTNYAILSKVFREFYKFKASWGDEN